ncbi:hypothetical protein Tco_0993562, partial [Tanacetum coccineum]
IINLYGIVYDGCKGCCYKMHSKLEKRDYVSVIDIKVIALCELLLLRVYTYRKFKTDVLNARRSMSSAQAALSSSKGGGYRFSKKEHEQLFTVYATQLVEKEYSHCHALLRNDKLPAPVTFPLFSIMDIALGKLVTHGSPRLKKFAAVESVSVCC